MLSFYIKLLFLYYILLPPGGYPIAVKKYIIS